MMKFGWIAATAALTLVCGSHSAFGVQAKKAKVPTIQGLSAIPNTPSGSRLKDWLKAVSTGDLETIIAFMNSHYDAEDLKQFPARDRAMGVMNGFYHFGAKHPIRVVQSGELETAIEGEAALSEQWLRVKIFVSPKGSHFISGVMIEPIEPPAEWAEKKVASSRDLISRMERFVQDMANSDLFSGVVLVAKGNKVLFQQAYGYADKERKIKNSMDTRFGLASMGKMFTAVSIAQLVEAGKLRYEDKLIKVLPDYPNKAVAEKITVHQLLTHTSGLGDFFDKPGIFEALPRLKGPRDYFPFFANDPLRFEPGMGWDYSNAGFVVLGAIIEQVSGQDYSSYVQEHVFRPAGMTHSAHDTIHGKVPNLAVAYSFEGGDTQRRGNIVSDTGGPAGGGASTAGDLLHFAQALLSHRLVNAKSLETMTTPKAKVIYEKDEDYGYGFMLRNENGHPVFGHGGGFPGVCTQMDVYPKDGYVVVVLSNYDPVMGYTIANKVRRMVAAG
jgi:CubicO group peptidase (beta-lactamase class C family)